MVDADKACHILVIGDHVLDTYTFGSVHRVSREAPVPVVVVNRREERPGMAGNVIRNLRSLEADVSMIGRKSENYAGLRVKHLLDEEALKRWVWVSQDEFTIPVKDRIIAGSQQMLRLDYETFMALAPDLEAELLPTALELVEAVDVVVFSDYGQGFCSDGLLAGVIAKSVETNTPVIVDPQGADYRKYGGATVLTPNLKQAYEASRMPADADLEVVAQTLLADTQSEYILITRAEQGMSLFHRSGTHDHFPVEEQREVRDVTGAGDTVVAALAYGLGCGWGMPEAIRFANIAAGIAIEHLGCARVSLDEIRARQAALC